MSDKKLSERIDKAAQTERERNTEASKGQESRDSIQKRVQKTPDVIKKG